MSTAELNKSAGCAVKVLAVGDMAENLVGLEPLVRRDGLELFRADSGRVALELLLIHDVALLLVDLQMPDGFELAERIRGSERTRQLPILFIAADAHSAKRVFQACGAGAVDVLYKPIEPDWLASKVEVFVQLYRQRWALAEALRTNEVFMSVLNHDLRNPLGVVRSTSFMLESRADPDVRQMATRLTRTSQRMTRMVSDLLDAARARSSGGIVLNKLRCDLGVI